jgi:hypothetical protein
MTDPIYRYTIDPSVPITEVEITLLLSIIAIESLHGESQARLDASHAFDAEKRTAAIDGTTGVGRDLNKLFAGFLVKEFGAMSFRVERVPKPQRQPEPVTA